MVKNFISNLLPRSSTAGSKNTKSNHSMGDIRNIIKNHSMKHFLKIKAITDPLCKLLEIPFFAYYRIEPDGRFVSLSNDPEPFHFYCFEEKFLKNPYLTHPRFFRSGFVFCPADPDASMLEIFQNQFSMYFFIILLRRRGESIEAFLFGNHNPDPKATVNIISKSNLLQKFASYFVREARFIIAEILNANYNLKNAKKEAFFIADPSIPLVTQNPSALKFLQEIAPLSAQEFLCLELFKQGHSSQSAASVLKLSPRTVECYFENIKNKLGCSSKWDLLRW